MCLHMLFKKKKKTWETFLSSVLDAWWCGGVCVCVCGVVGGGNWGRQMKS